MQRKKVLLPEPEAPIIDTTSPTRAVMETPFRTSRGPKFLCRSFTTTASGCSAAVVAGDFETKMANSKHALGAGNLVSL